MKLTKAQLKQIIKEELQKEMVSPQQPPESIEAPEATPEEDRPADISHIVNAVLQQLRPAVEKALESAYSHFGKAGELGKKPPEDE